MLGSVLKSESVPKLALESVRFVAKLGPGSVAIVFGMAAYSNLVNSNLNFTDYNGSSWPFLIPEI
jgi:hypothetical protein